MDKPLCTPFAIRRHVVGTPNERLMKIMKTALSLTMLLFATMAGAQGKPDEAAIRSILQEEVPDWNKGDAQAYSQHFAADGTFTNIRGMFFTCPYQKLYRPTIKRSKPFSMRSCLRSNPRAALVIP